MAAEVTIGGGGKLFVGEDKTVRLEVRDANGVPVNAAGWAIDLVIAKTDKGDPILTKHAAQTGAYNADPDVNTLRFVVVFTDTELNLFKASTYRHGWKRMDDNSETVLAYGPWTLQKAPPP